MKNTTLINLKNRLAVTILAVAALILPAKAANGEALRVRNNVEKLQLIHAPSRPKFAATLRDLESHGRRPYIVDSYRNPATQAALKARGVSTVSWSFHNAQTPGGKPDALAMDVSEMDGLGRLKYPSDFLLMLAGAARSHNLETGVLWGLSQDQRARLNVAIARRDWQCKAPQGWDAGHVQITKISLGQARKGVRL